MNNSLSQKSRPSEGLMSKKILQDPIVINYITTTLANIQNDHYVENLEWSDGTRSDVVLEPKSYIVQHTTASCFPGSCSFPPVPWAADCVIFSKESLDEGNIDTPLNPFIAPGLFFTHRGLSIVNVPFADDPTIQYLYTLALSNEEDQHNNILLPLRESQSREYERLLSLANTVGSPDVLIQAINDAKPRNDEFK